MNPLQERLQAFLNLENISMRSFERQCDIKTGTASKMTEKSYGTTFHKIAKAFPQLNLDWLKTGEGEMLNTAPAVDLDFNLKFGNNGQLAFGDINNIGDTKTKVIVLLERIKVLEALLKSKENEIADKNARIAELNASLERERKMNDFLIGKK